MHLRTSRPPHYLCLASLPHFNRTNGPALRQDTHKSCWPHFPPSGGTFFVRTRTPAPEQVARGAHTQLILSCRLSILPSLPPVPLHPLHHLHSTYRLHCEAGGRSSGAKVHEYMQGYRIAEPRLSTQAEPQIRYQTLSPVA